MMEIVRSHNGNGKVAAPAQYVALAKADQNAMRRIWPRVRLGCMAVKALDKRGDGATWDVTHVRAQLDLAFAGRGTAELWQIMDERGEMRGFLVTIIGNCPYRQTPQSLIVWVAYTFRPLPGRIVRAVLPQLEEYARSLGLEYVDGYSTSIRWLKWLDRYGKGYRPAQFMFRKNLWKD